MTCGYRIWIRGEYDISVLSPEIIALLVEKVKKAASKDLIIPVEEIIPRGYAEYLVRVLEVNMTTEAPCDMRAVYGMTARQIGALKVEEHKCFDRACLRTQACGTALPFICWRSRALRTLLISAKIRRERKSAGKMPQYAV